LSGSTIADGNGGLNYTILGQNGNATSTINTAVLSITANDASRSFGNPNPPFSATYTGLVGGDTPIVLTGAISFATPATVVSPIGIYAVVPSGQSSSNYVINYVNGALTVLAPSGGTGAVILPVQGRDAALQTLGIKSYAELWSDCVGGGKASAGVAVASGAQMMCDAGAARKAELPAGAN
jgi:hypothetical protein